MLVQSRLTQNGRYLADAIVFAFRRQQGSCGPAGGILEFERYHCLHSKVSLLDVLCFWTSSSCLQSQSPFSEELFVKCLRYPGGQ